MGMVFRLRRWRVRLEASWYESGRRPLGCGSRATSKAVRSHVDLHVRSTIAWGELS